MKELTLEQMIAVQGGNSNDDLVGFIDGFCTGVAVAALFTVVGTGIGVACAGWAISRLF